MFFRPLTKTAPPRFAAAPRPGIGSGLSKIHFPAAKRLLLLLFALCVVAAQGCAARNNEELGISVELSSIRSTPGGIHVDSTTLAVTYATPDGKAFNTKSLSSTEDKTIDMFYKETYTSARGSWEGYFKKTPQEQWCTGATDHDVCRNWIKEIYHSSSATDEKVMALLFPKTPVTPTDLNVPNLTLQDLGVALKTNTGAATAPP